MSGLKAIVSKSHLKHSEWFTCGFIDRRPILKVIEKTWWAIKKERTPEPRHPRYYVGKLPSNLQNSKDLLDWYHPEHLLPALDAEFPYSIPTNSQEDEALEDGYYDSAPLKVKVFREECVNGRITHIPELTVAYRPGWWDMDYDLGEVNYYREY